MSLPKLPSPTSLDGSCTVIYNGKLYSYSPQGFLALPLEDGGDWKELPTGETVAGGVCVGSTPADATQAGFFVIGGTSGSPDYTGAQKYTYSTGNWTTIPLSGAIMQGRIGHGATYMQAGDRILVYSGSQDGTASTATFTIRASEPFGSDSGTSTAPAVVSPILLPWSDTEAMLVPNGGPDTQVYLFTQENNAWQTSGASLAAPLAKGSSMMQAILVQGDDESRSLYTFDMSQSPNQVQRYVLQNADGTRVSLSGPVANERRELSLNAWPDYNSTLVPSSTRQNFAIARGPDGQVVFSGGNTDDPLAIFDANENSWVNATELFSGKEQKILDVTSTISTATSTSTSKSHTKTSSTFTSTSIQSTTMFTTTSAAPASTSTEAAASDSNGPSSNAILGITLGSIGAFLAVLILILFFLRRRKIHQTGREDARARATGGAPSDEKDYSGFRNTHLAPTSHFRGHQQQRSQDSFSSMAILMGRINKQKTSLTRKPSNETRRSSVSSIHKDFKSTISKPIPHTMQHSTMQGRDERGVVFAPGVAERRPCGGAMDRPDGTRRSSGWNRYWSGGSGGALQLLGFGGSKRTTVGSDSSHYSEAGPGNPRVTQDSATVPPLNFEGPAFEGRASVSRVNSGSPIVAQYSKNVPFKDGMAGKIERPVSRASTGGYSSGIPESVAEVWNPADGERPWGADRAPSGTYNPSFYYGASLAPSDPTSKQSTSGSSRPPQLAMNSTASDMSWLNLGDQSRDRSRA